MAGEWLATTLGDVIELKRGYDLPSAQRRAGSFPIVSSGGVSGTHSEAMVRGPGVATGRYGTIGQVHYIDEDFWPLNTALYVRDFKGSNPRFVAYFLKTVDFWAYSDKAAVPGINRNHLHEAQVVWPPRSEQVAISNLLGLLDDKIESNRSMSQTLDYIARALFRSWFVDFAPVWASTERPPGISAEVSGLFPSSLSDGALGEQPEGWRISNIGSEVSVIGGNTPSTASSEFWGQEYAWATPKDLSGLDVPVLLETSRSLTTAGLGKVSSGLLPVDTVLLSSRAPIGYLAVAKVPMAINQGFIAMVCDRTIGPWFTYLWTAQNMEVIKSRANGSTFQEISKGSFRGIELVVPPAPVAECFEQIVRPMFDRIELNARQSRTLAGLRDLLLPKLMSGAVRVKDAEAILEQVA